MQPVSMTTKSIPASPCLAFDDPVPSDSVILGETAVMPTARPHSVERQVQRKLLAQPNLQFSSLVVRRMPDGVCIEGVLDSTDGSDVTNLARQVAGVQNVVNRLLVRSAEASC
jgi:osmotically-inducible protein OsmY